MIQRALVLEDYTPALGVAGFVSRKKGARSKGKEEKEGENNNSRQNDNVYRKLGSKIYMKKKEEINIKKKIKLKKPFIMWGLVMLVHAWGSS